MAVLIKDLGFLKQYRVSISKGFQKIVLPSILFDRNQIKLWWPRGYGKQQLYQIQVKRLTYTPFNA